MFDHWNLLFLLTNYIKSSHHKIILWKLLYVSHDTRRLPSVEESQDKYLMMIWCSKRTDGSGDEKEKGSSLLNHFISFNSSFSFSPLSIFCFWCFPSLLPSYLLNPFIIPLFYLYSNSFFSSFLVPVLFFLSYKPFFFISYHFFTFFSSFCSSGDLWEDFQAMVFSYSAGGQSRAPPSGQPFSPVHFPWSYFWRW